ncbi:MAG: M20 family metallopeptidase [Promethearchaeota archaeon]
MATLGQLGDALAKVDDLPEERVVGLLDDLVRIRTVSTPGDKYVEFVEYLEAFLSGLGFELERVVVPPEKLELLPVQVSGERVNLVATRHHGRGRELCVYCHMDVVPAEDDEDDPWRYPPFEVTVRGRSRRSKRLFGRGVADMKGSMACLLLALEVADRAGLAPAFDLRLVFCTDEELGVYPGVQYLAENGHLGEGPILCLDGGLMDRLIVGALGDLIVNVETRGVSAHSGMNFMGVNAVDCMVPILDEMMLLKKEVEARRSSVPGLARTETPDERFMSPMFNLNVLQAGSHERHNVMPASCELTIDRRLIPEERLDEVKGEILEAVERGKARMAVPAREVEVTFQYNYPPAQFDQGSWLFRQVRGAIELVHGIPRDEIPLWSLPASTDMGSVIEVLGRNDVVMRGVANPASNPHGVNESIKLGDAYQFVKELVATIYGDF